MRTEMSKKELTTSDLDGRNMVYVSFEDDRITDSFLFSQFERHKSELFDIIDNGDEYIIFHNNNSLIISLWRIRKEITSALLYVGKKDTNEHLSQCLTPMEDTKEFIVDDKFLEFLEKSVTQRQYEKYYLQPSEGSGNIKACIKALEDKWA